MTKSLRNKPVSKRLKQRIRGGDKMSSAARKIKNLAQKGQSKKKNKGSKKTQKTVRKRSKRSVRGGTKSDNKKRSAAQKVQSMVRGYLSRKHTPQDELKEKMRLAVNKVKDSKCSICQEMIRVPEDMTSCANNHNFHKDCILKWCKSGISGTQVEIVDETTKSVTTCPICTDTIVCPGNIEEISDARHRDQNQMNAASLEETRLLYAAEPTEWNREYDRLIRQPIPETEEERQRRLLRSQYEDLFVDI